MDAYSIISLLTMIVTVILLWKIRKRADYSYSLLDTSCVILNLVLIVMIYPPLCVAAALMEIDSFATEQWGIIAEDIIAAMGRLMPAVCVSCVGASALMRRKERPVLSFWLQFIGALWFGIIMLLMYVK